MKQRILSIWMLLLMILISNTAFANYIESESASNTPTAIEIEKSTSTEDQSDDFVSLENESSNLSELVSSDNPYDVIKQKVLSENRMVAKLDSAAFFSLPVGIGAGGDKGDDYAIIIDKASLHPEYAEFSAFMVLTNPMDGKKVRFRADNIRFTFKGGLQSKINLVLIDTLSTKLFKDAKLNWLPQSYVEWDCNGFKQIGLNGEIELSDKAFVKVNPTTFAEIPGKIKNQFFINIADFNNYILETSLPAVKVRGFDEVCFTFDKIALDNSDYANLPGFSFPDKYPGDYTGDKANLWRGLSVKSATVTLSPKFNKKSGASTTFFAENLLIDENGFTGLCGVDNLLTPNEGQLGNWKMAISHLGLEFFTGSFKSLAIKGSTTLPGTTSPLTYDAFFDVSGAFHMTINTITDIKFNVLAANITLLNTSKIEVAIDADKKFVPTATLDGNISFACSKDTASTSTIASMPQIDFQQMRISAAPPVFDVDYFGFASKSGMKFKAFPITIKTFAFSRRSEDLAAIEILLTANLTESSGEGIGGELGFSILADTHNWKYKGLEISKVSINASKPGAYEISGSLEIKDDDPIYGDGFRGEITAKFGGDFKADAVALFGNKGGMRYFMVDAFLCLPEPGITCGPFILTGFGGGMYYKMRPTMPKETSGSDFGKGLTDIIYVPDATKSLGIKAAVKAAIVRKELVDAKISFEINFYNSGGIASLIFLGDARILSVPKAVSNAGVKAMSRLTSQNKEQEESTGEMMRAKVSIVLDFENETFESTMDLYVDVAGVLKGIGPNNRAGWSSMYINRKTKKWHMLMGTPAQPMGVDFVGLMQVGGYFMAGQDLPIAVQIPQEVLTILHMTQEQITNESAKNGVESGNGVAFGAFVKFDTGQKTFLIFYGQLQLGGGFDVSLIEYPNSHCKGSSGEIGINGWYAKGDAYAYLNGQIGLKAKIFGRTRKYSILSIGAAAVVMLEGPNPIWFKGVAGGDYDILGGLISGNCQFEFTMGDKCDIVTNDNLADIEIIGSIAPMQDATKVDVFTLPQVVFNLPVNKAARVSEDANTTQQFKVVIKELAIYQNDVLIGGEFAWDAQNKTAAFTPNTIFSPNTKYKIVVKAGFQQKENARSEWVDYKDDAGAIYVESKEATFETGELPDKIPARYISYSYPTDRMSNFYKQESNTAYVTFAADILPFFLPKAGWAQKVKWTPAGGGAPIYSALTYTPANKSAETTVPATLTNSTVYKIELVNTPVSTGSSITSNVETTNTLQLTATGDTMANIATRAAQGVIVNTEEKAFYGADFRTSMYNKFFDKITATELNVRFLYNVKPALDYPGSTIYGTEMLDGFEIVGSGKQTPLVSCEAVLDGADWYQTNIYPLMYANYPLAPSAKVSRDITANGIPPTKTVEIWQEYYNYQLTDADIVAGKSSSAATLTHFVYYVPSMWADDYTDIRNSLSNLVSQNSVIVTPAITKILKTFPWPQVSVGNYPIILKYHLPGRNTVTSSKQINLKNSIDVKQVNLLSDDK